VKLERLRDLLVPVLENPDQAGEVHWTGVKVHGWLKEQLELEVGYSTTMRYLHDLGYNLRVPRQDPLCRSLHENQTGLLFPPRDAKALAETILRLVSDLDCRVRIGTTGAREVREKWLWHRIVEKMRRVYEELIPVARDIAILPQAANLHALATAA
jgi:hypothetical protein